MDISINDKRDDTDTQFEMVYTPSTDNLPENRNTTQEKSVKKEVVSSSLSIAKKVTPEQEKKELDEALNFLISFNPTDVLPCRQTTNASDQEAECSGATGSNTIITSIDGANINLLSEF